MIFASYSNEHTKRERRQRKRKEGWGITRRMVIIFKGAYLESMFVVFVVLYRIEVGGCADHSSYMAPLRSSKAHQAK